MCFISVLISICVIGCFLMKMDKMKRFLHNYVTFRISILALFLSLFSISFVLVISFTYYKNSKSILEFSVGVVERVSTIVLEKIEEHISEAKQVPEESAGLFLEISDVSFEDKELISYMLNVVNINEEFVSYFYVGTTEGNYIGVNTIPSEQKSFYITDPSKPLPKGTRFVLYFVDRTKGEVLNTWNYKNIKFETIGQEEVKGEFYDPRTRPWYQGALESKGVHWTDVYTYAYSYIPGEKGIAVSQPIINSKEEIIGVVGADISLNLLSDFLSKQVIGKSGKVYLLNKEGEVLLPKLDQGQNSTVSKDIIKSSFKKYLSDQKHSFIIEEKGTKFLADIHEVPIIKKREWFIAVIVPLSDFFGELLHTQAIVVWITILILIFSGLLVFYFSKTISSPIVVLSKEIDKIQQLELDSSVRVKSRIKEIKLMDSSLAAMRISMHSFARYVPRKIVKYLIDRGEEVTLGGEKKEITIFFSDIEDFTSVAEIYPTDTLMTLLTDYFDELSKIILDNNGIIDKYIGDSIMAFWGAPIEIPDHAEMACITALYCKICLDKLNKKQKEEGKPVFITRIGINTGTVIVGNIGTSERMNYTVIGDSVNTASRLQLVNKIFKTTIIISEKTYSEVQGLFLVRPLDVVIVKGKKEKIKIFELVAKLQGDNQILPTPEQSELCTIFTKGYEAFYQNDFVKAREFFEESNRKFPNDIPSKIYLERIKETFKK